MGCYAVYLRGISLFLGTVTTVTVTVVYFWGLGRDSIGFGSTAVVTMSMSDDDGGEAVAYTEAVQLILQKLISRPELNGKAVIVDGYNRERRRWDVRIGAEATSGLGVKAGCLTVCVLNTLELSHAALMVEAAVVTAGGDQWMLRVSPGCSFVAGHDRLLARPAKLVAPRARHCIPTIQLTKP